MHPLHFEAPKNKSSQVIEMAYDDESNTAVIHFPGVEYHYNMPRETFEAWRDAESAGKFLHSVIKSDPQAFPFHKVTDGDECDCFAPRKSEEA